MKKHTLPLIAACTALGLAATACGADTTTATGADLEGRTIEIVGPWSGSEQESFEQVLEVFEDRTGATVKYSGAADDLPTVLQTRIRGGDVPNVALVPQPGLIAQFVEADALKPLSDDVVDALDENMAGAWTDFGSVDGTPYGVYFKVANKSLVWYNDGVFAETGAETPETWDDFLGLSEDLADVGLTPQSVAAADGWVLTDWFENVYLQTAGPEQYDRLAAHEIPWTDPSVAEALEKLAELWGSEELIAGGTRGALQTDFPTSVTNVFNDDPQASMVVGADFIGTVVSASTGATVGDGARTFRFPAVGENSDAVVVAGDAAVALKDDEATMELLRFLASPEAASTWAGLGGFVSPNRNVPAEAYADELTGQIAEQVVRAGEDVRFDLSDLQPSAFGATVGGGMWQTLQDFFADPDDVDGAMERLEADAARAHGK
ncbi:alpha-glucoside transport system substrate-binding protein [Nocardiopsis mwathae]|uniref:Alpha-glucoside transport system substrate-binding protein n=1 Tax=Nocardiopsis mwathae TaxID=1472723 RepID=A0A7W9YGB1_9ACTN|nr:extracellular solute-binding protein [Nocardiopsis mwathae]MBB6170756.1 alpha-glucoside transport system substrate-binding protein [Nocardiopsis mwathae]